MRIHSASSLGFARISERGEAGPDFPWRDTEWATLKRGDELVQVRAVAMRADGSFIGEVFGLDGEGADGRDAIRHGDQLAFTAEHVFAYELFADRKRSDTESEERLRRADRLKAALISTLTREVRTPATALTSTLRFLQAKAPPDLKFAVDLLERQVDQLKRLLGDVLDLSRIQHGAWSVKKRRVDLAWVLHAAIEEVRQSFDERQQHFADSYPQQRIELEADASRLAEAVAKLLDNASRYTPAGGRIGLHVARHADRIVIKVTDTGIGIPEALRGRIFEPFVQIESGGEGREGLGIGLALVKSIVEAHDGAIEVESGGPGAGTAFVVSLPAAPATGRS